MLTVSLGSLAATSMKGGIFGRYLGEDPKSEELISNLKSRLAVCLEHPKCATTLSGTARVNPEKTSLPNRCIDVSSETVRLKETRLEVGSYVTLSHRWNDKTEASQTTTTNYADRTKLLQLDRLPKAFRDAIWLTRRLGLRYLWIDSICIIQKGDGGQDWKVEALNMARYYQHSRLTIAGTACDEKDGLFPPSSRPRPYNIVQLPYRNASGERQGHFYVYQCDNQIESNYQAGIIESTLLQRGWVFQEWILSRRIVCYTKYGVFYQCQTLFPSNSEFEFVFPDPSKPTAQVMFFKTHFDFKAARSLEKLWRDLIEVYSGRHLTKPDKDRILALAGVAKEFKEALIDRGKDRGKQQGTEWVGSLEYASGLWFRDIHHGLLWEMGPDSSGATERLPGTPTWSWASRMLGVQWSSGNRPTEHACKVVDLISVNGVSLAIAKAGALGILALKEFGVGTMFASLLILGRAQEVHIRRRLSSEEEIQEARTVTGHSFGSKHWRAVCSPVSPDIINGWASIEEPALEADLLPGDDCVVQALHVSTARGIEGGLKLGYFWPTHHVFHVLLIKRSGGRVFERLGRGILYGKDISRGFQEAAELEIELV
jgi:hypothetical protein